MRSSSKYYYGLSSFFSNRPAAQHVGMPRVSNCPNNRFCNAVNGYYSLFAKQSLSIREVIQNNASGAKRATKVGRHFLVDVVQFRHSRSPKRFGAKSVR